MYEKNRRTYRYKQPKNFHFTRSHCQKSVNVSKKLQCKKAHGTDELPPNLLKDVAEEISKPMAFIISKSLSSGIVPDLWKISKVTPLYKLHSKSDFSNYCPISVLPCLSKVLEQVVHWQLSNYLEKHYLIKAADSDSVHEDLWN